MSLFVDFKDGISKDEFDMAKETIEKNGIIAFPIESIYALGTSVYNEDGIMKLFDIKNRPHSKPITVLVSDISMIKKVSHAISDDERKVIDAFFPGPLTLVLDKKDTIPDIISEGNNTIGVRMPDSKIALKLLRNLKVPIATTSANISGFESERTIEGVQRDFGNMVDCYIDAGEFDEEKHSTVVRIEDGEVFIIREGVIPKEEIEKVIKEGKE